MLEAQPRVALAFILRMPVDLYKDRTLTVLSDPIKDFIQRKINIIKSLVEPLPGDRPARWNLCKEPVI